jgi:hypothetical protein
MLAWLNSIKLSNDSQQEYDCKEGGSCQMFSSRDSRHSIAIIVLCVASSSGICCNTTKISSLALQHTLTCNTEIHLKYFARICKICLHSRKTTVLLIIGCLYDIRLKDVPVYSAELYIAASLTFSHLMTYIYVVPHRQPPDDAFYIFIQQIYVLNILNMLHTLRFFLFKMPFIS